MQPDYDHARQQAGFHWSAAATQGSLREISGIPIREFNLKPPACIEAFRKGRQLTREMFGPDVSLPGVTTPAVSYGHANCLGSELLFPEGGEVAHTHIYDSLEQGLAALEQPVDWAGAGMLGFYRDFQQQLREAFPGEPVGLSFGAEGPLTTAYELRGDGFFTDLFDDLPGVQEFLRRIVASVLDFDAFLYGLDGRPLFNPEGAGTADDIASFVPPQLWPEVVLPAWEQLFSSLTSGRRNLHVEDLRVEQLPLLEQAQIAFYDPSISPRVTPALIRDHCRVPFLWLLVNFHYREMDVQEVEDFVFMAAADGASMVATHVEEGSCNPEMVTKIEAFIRAAKEAEAFLNEGGSREELRQRVSPAGREKLWDAWCGHLGPKSSRGGATG